MTIAVTDKQNEDEVSLADKRVEVTTYDRYKGRKDQVDRLAFLSTNLMRGYTHYRDKAPAGQAKVFRCVSTPTHRGACCDALGEPAQRFGLVVFKYHTDDKGMLNDSEKLQGKLMFWVISETRYEELSTIHRQWPLLDGGQEAKQMDLSIRCTEEAFQKMTFTPCPEAHWKKKDIWYKAMKGKEAKAKERLKGVIGKVVTELEIKEMLGSSVPMTPPTEAPGDIDLSDVLDE